MVAKLYCDICGEEMQSNENRRIIEFDYSSDNDSYRCYSGNWCWKCSAIIVETIEGWIEDAKKK